MDIVVGKKYYHTQRRAICEVLELYESDLHCFIKVQILEDKEDYYASFSLIQWVHRTHLVPMGPMTEAIYGK